MLNYLVLFICLAFYEFGNDFTLITKPTKTSCLIDFLSKSCNVDVSFSEQNAMTKALSLKKKSLDEIIKNICDKSDPKLIFSKNNNYYSIQAKTTSTTKQKTITKKIAANTKQNEKCKHKIIAVSHAHFDKELEKSLNDFWHNLTGNTPDHENKLIIIDNDLRFISAKGTEEEIEVLENFVRAIDKPVKRVKIDAILITNLTESDLAMGISWSGIYNRLKTVQKSEKDFAFVGMGARSAVAIPEPTFPVFSDDGQRNNNLFVDPTSFNINTFVSPISTDFGLEVDQAKIFSSFSASPIGFKLPIVFGGPNLNLRRLSLVLNANAAEEKIKIIAKPSVVTNNDTVAKLYVSDSLPFYNIVVQSIESAQNLRNLTTFFYRDIGVTLQVKPTIIDDQKHISLDIYSEFSEVTSGNTNLTIDRITGYFVTPNPPILLTIKMKDVVVVQNEQVIILGGLSQLRKREETNQVPFLNKLPLAGKGLFSSKGELKRERNDFIFISASIIE